jgi:hypothetical protein
LFVYKRTVGTITNLHIWFQHIQTKTLLRIDYILFQQSKYVISFFVANLSIYIEFGTYSRAGKIATSAEKKTTVGSGFCGCEITTRVRVLWTLLELRSLSPSSPVRSKLFVGEPLLQATRTLSCVLSRRALPVAAILAPPFSPATGTGSGQPCHHHPRRFHSSQRGYLRSSQRCHLCFLDSAPTPWIRPLLESPPSPIDSPLLLHGFSCCFTDLPPPRIPSISHGFAPSLSHDSPLLLHGFGCCFMHLPPPRIPSCSHGFGILLAWIRSLLLSIHPFPPAPMDLPTS